MVSAFTPQFSGFEYPRLGGQLFKDETLFSHGRVGCQVAGDDLVTEKGLLDDGVPWRKMETIVRFSLGTRVWFTSMFVLISAL